MTKNMFTGVNGVSFLNSYSIFSYQPQKFAVDSGMYILRIFVDQHQIKSGWERPLLLYVANTGRNQM